MLLINDFHTQTVPFTDTCKQPCTTTVCHGPLELIVIQTKWQAEH